MNIVNKVKVTICGKEYNLRTDETAEYLTALAKRVDKEINDMVKAKPNFGIQNAAVFVALTALDEAQKATDSIENIRTQIKTSLTDAAKARKEKDKLAEKNKALSDRIEELEREIKELKKQRPQFDCEQLVLENTITPAVTVYAEEMADEDKSGDLKDDPAPEKQSSEAHKDETSDNRPVDEVPEEAPKEISPEENKDEAPAQTAECGSDASNGEEKPAGMENGGADGGASSEAQNDGGDTQNADLTSHRHNSKNKKKRR